MKRRRAYALTAFFLMTTAALTPVAFQIGKAHGARPSSKTAQFVSYFGPYETIDRGALARDCPDLGQPGAIARNFAVIDCQEFGRGGRSLRGARQVRAGSQNDGGAAPTNVRDRLVQRLAAAQQSGAELDSGQGIAGAGKLTAPAGANGAIASGDVVTFTAGVLANTGGSGGFSGGSPTLPGGGGVPLILLPAAFQSASPVGDEIFDGAIGDPVGDSVDLVTPLPAGAIIFLTGALFLAAQTRKF